MDVEASEPVYRCYFYRVDSNWFDNNAGVR